MGLRWLKCRHLRGGLVDGSVPIFVVRYQSFGDGDGVQVTCHRYWTALVSERSGERSLVSDQVLDRTRAVIGRASFGERPISDFVPHVWQGHGATLCRELSVKIRVTKSSKL